MFPGGAVGVALIVLRACVLASLWMETVSRDRHIFASWPMLGLSLIGIFIATGALTPFACLLCIAIELWSFNLSAGDPLLMVLSISLSVVLAMLGPGAFSIDAKLFGRRRIIPKIK
jgi:hypothetical protein